jgi:hypothetical protein
LDSLEASTDLSLTTINSKHQAGRRRADGDFPAPRIGFSRFVDNRAPHRETLASPPQINELGALDG